MTDLDKARRNLRNALRETMQLLELDDMTGGWLDDVLRSQAAIARAFAAISAEAPTPAHPQPVWRPRPLLEILPEPDDDEGDE